MCPTGALAIERWPQVGNGSNNWTLGAMQDVAKQAQTGAVLLSSMGNPQQYPLYWDHLLLNASQVTNPSIDPLREPMETRVLLGSRPDALKVNEREHTVETKMPPQIKLDVPLMFSAMSFGSISLNAQKSLAMAAEELGTYFNTGEGGLHKDLERYGDHAIVQVASGRFGVDAHYLNAGAMVEIKIGQGAKPGIGGHLPGEKIDDEVSQTRMIPKGTDAISPAPHHDIYSIEDLRQLVFSLKEATGYRKPIAVKIAAVHNAAAIASGMARAGADVIVIDGFRGGTGAAPARIRDNVGIPIELALAAVDQRPARRRNPLTGEPGRRRLHPQFGGRRARRRARGRCRLLRKRRAYRAGLPPVPGLRERHLQLGHRDAAPRADETPQSRDRGRARGEPRPRLEHEVQEMMGGMGINAIDSLRGNRLMLRGIGLNEKELEILGVKCAGE